jgi:hypothetical protein
MGPKNLTVSWPYRIAGKLKNQRRNKLMAVPPFLNGNIVS